MSIVKIAAKKEKKDPWQSAKRGALYGAGIGAIITPAGKLVAYLSRGNKLKDMANPVSSVLKTMGYGATLGGAIGGFGGLLKDKLSDEVKKSG